ncbi:right-handed parallel beta-helix repeat-containing protein [Limimaricola sp.]|uniref:right-handed parallel beta-helix repeat-containing protein n=1 Tax=Limimaricola sp. TaxID=2211665 RepID=UPI0040587255
MPVKVAGRGARGGAYRLAVLFLAALPGAAPADPQAVAPGRLHAALAQVRGGEVIRLAGGRHAPLALRDRAFARPVTLVSADPAAPAVFPAIRVDGVSGLRFDGVTIDYDHRPDDPPGRALLAIANARDIVFRNGLLDGDRVRGTGTAADGIATGLGVGIRASSGIVIEATLLRDLYVGITMRDSAGITLRGNDIHGIRLDGVQIRQVDGLLIEDNHIHDFHGLPGWREHRDMIQMWSTGATAPSTKITIRNNHLNSAHGDETQSVFLRNELVDTGRAGPEMHYRDITIEQNVIVNAHLHGITVGEADGVTIRRNTLIRNRLQGEADNPAQWTPRITVAPGGRDVRIERNAAIGVTTPRDGRAGWVVASNVSIQDQAPMQPGHYGAVFADALHGDPADLASFAYRTGGPLQGHGMGAARLDRDRGRSE